MEFRDLLLIISTILGPILAVQAQKWIERATETRGRKLKIYYTLMSTRALKASSSEHVQALNSLDLVFSNKENKNRKIIEQWNIYRDHLNNYPADNELTEAKRWIDVSNEKLASSLKSIGDSLGFHFDEVQIKRGIYYPRGHDEDITARIALRNILTKLSSGEWALPLDIRKFPVDSDLLSLQVTMQNELISVLKGQNSINVNLAAGIDPRV